MRNRSHKTINMCVLVFVGGEKHLANLLLLMVSSMSHAELTWMAKTI
jgi:hypothetical protein